jgi:hypothetical protein
MKTGHWKKSEASKRLNWDFSFCNWWPESLVRSVYEYECKRDLAARQGQSPKPPFNADAKKVESWFLDHVNMADYDHKNSDVLLHIPREKAQSATEALDGIYRIETFAICADSLRRNDHEELLVDAFKKWLVSARRKMGVRPGSPIKYSGKLRDLAMHRLADAGYAHDSEIGEKCLRLYAPQLFGRTASKDPLGQRWREGKRQAKKFLKEEEARRK